jgi:hypothetical protein
MMEPIARLEQLTLLPHWIGFSYMFYILLPFDFLMREGISNPTHNKQSSTTMTAACIALRLLLSAAYCHVVIYFRANSFPRLAIASAARN